MPPATTAQISRGRPWTEWPLEDQCGTALGGRPGRVVQGGSDVTHLEDPHAGGCRTRRGRSAARRNQRVPEAEAGGLGQPPLDRADPAHLPGEPDLTDR